MLEEILDWVFIAFAVGVVSFFFCGFWYIIAIKPIIYNYRLKKAKRLYPEFYLTMEERDSICLNELHKAYDEEEKFQHSIDCILKEMPYTPLEDCSSKQIEIEVLKKKRLKAILEAKTWQKEVDKYTDLINRMIDNSELLTKIYRND